MAPETSSKDPRAAAMPFLGCASRQDLSIRPAESKGPGRELAPHDPWAQELAVMGEEFLPFRLKPARVGTALGMAGWRERSGSAGAQCLQCTQMLQPTSATPRLTPVLPLKWAQGSGTPMWGLLSCLAASLGL